MDLRRILNKNRRLFRRKSRGRSQSSKNGALIAALVASTVFTIALGFLNLRLWNDPPPVREVQGEHPKNHSSRALHDTAGASQDNSSKEKSTNRPVIRFYHDLEAQDDHGPWGLNATSGQAPDTANCSETQKKTQSPADKIDSNPTIERPLAAIPASKKKPTKDSRNRSVKSQKSNRKYTVQVGAFAHPGIALQWVEKWKARGYKVTLTPVARPGTGVIYRLHLGSFSSKKKADSLVNRLRTKEGVSAMLLLVSN